MPRTSPFVIELSPGERKVLESMVRSYTSPYCDVVRAKIALYAAKGLGNDEIALRAQSRRTWRSDRPMNSPAFACVSRPSTTRRTTSRRSNSFLLIATSSVPIHPAPWRQRAAETGHLYLGGTGHFHFASTIWIR